jgi:small-conductance mechanosensitive channel
MKDRILWPSHAADWLAQNRHELLIGGLAALAAVAIMLLLREIGRQISARDPHCRTWRSVIGRVLSKTSLVFMVVAALDVLASYTDPPQRIARIVDIAFVIVAALQGAVWARELIMGVVGRHSGDEVGESALANARAVIRVLVSVALFAIAIIVILDNLGVNVTALVAGLGIGGIAIGLAAQGIFSDLFAALSILFDKPFRRGDTIRYDDSVGTVERIGLKTTRLRSLNGESLVMSNKNLLDKEIHNFAEGQSRRTQLPFGLIYQTPPEQLEKIMPLAKAAVESRKNCNFVRCAIAGFGPSSIDFEFIYETRSIDIGEISADRTAIALTLMRTFAKHGIQFAYPTQTTFTAAPDGTMIMPYPASPPASPRASRKSR